VGLIERGQFWLALGYSGVSLLGALVLTGMGLLTVNALR